MTTATQLENNYPNIKKTIQRKKSIPLDYDKIKTKVIAESAHNLPKDYSGELILKLRKLDLLIKNESDKYYYNKSILLAMYNKPELNNMHEMWVDNVFNAH